MNDRVPERFASLSQMQIRLPVRTLRALAAPSIAFSIAFSIGLATGCSPKVEVTPPKEPITINLNVKIEHEIRVKVDKDLEDLFAEDEDLF